MNNDFKSFMKQSLTFFIALLLAPTAVLNAAKLRPVGVLGNSGGDGDTLVKFAGQVSTGLGLINVEWQRKGDVIEAMIETPTGVTLNAPSPNVRLNLKPRK